jgi:hypothetical protein
MTLLTEFSPVPLQATPARPAPEPLAPDRLARAKRSYTTRHLDLSATTCLLGRVAPVIGDVVLARVDAVGQHTRIEQPDGRKALLFPGDEVVVAYGHRYAPDQFEATVPTDLGPCQLVAAGGIAARVQAAHRTMSPATSLTPMGLLADPLGQRLNLRAGALPPLPPRPGSRPVTIAVVGAAMNAGKTTTAAQLVRGLARAGLQVGAAKVTGTGAGGDLWMLTDAGASPVLDFTCAGLPSTYRVGTGEVLRTFTELTDRLAAEGCDTVVLEVADGIYQEETAVLLQSPTFATRVDALLFAASDALGACAGVGWLRDRGLLPLAVSGVVSSSPLASREAESATGLPVWTTTQLADGGAAGRLRADLVGERRPWARAG